MILLTFQLLRNGVLKKKRRYFCCFESKDDIIDFIHKCGVKDVSLKSVRRNDRNTEVLTYNCVHPLGSPFLLVTRSNNISRDDLKVIIALLPTLFLVGWVY